MIATPVAVIRGTIPPPDPAEIARYLGYGFHVPEGADADLIRSVADELHGVLDCRACHVRAPLTPLDGGEPGLACGPLRLATPRLLRHLDGCVEAIVFVATIGLAADRLLARYKTLSPARAVVLQAAGAAAIEAWCDRLCADWATALAAEKLAVRSRYSPGYAQWPLAEAQRAIFGWLDPPRHVGVTLTDAALMVPTKSVSALVPVERG